MTRSLAAPAWTIVPMAPEHIEKAVRLHCETRPDEALAQLGTAVTRAFYRSWVAHPRCICLVGTDGDDVVSAVMGMLGTGFLRRIVRRHPLLIGGALAARALRSPRFVWELAMGTGRSGEPWPGDPARRFHVLTLEVASQWRGHGIVVPLLRAALLEARRRGAWDACTTVEDANLPSVWVYRALGFERSAPNRGVRHYRLDLRQVSWDGDASDAVPGARS